MARLNWTLHAADDLKNIKDFIAADSPIYSNIYIKKIKSKANKLKDLPLSGRIVPEIGNENIRELIFGNYRIIYKYYNSKRIDILTVFHSSRILKI